ncbi:MAG: Rho termination factor N-terminal domain-containing protein, partial [Aeromicrobium sp.]
MTETTTTDDSAAPAAAPRKTGGSLGGKVLAELQEIAGGLGISGAEKMRKGALIDAIKIARGDAGTSTKAAVKAASGPAADTTSAPAVTLPESKNDTTDAPREESAKADAPKADRPKRKRNDAAAKTDAAKDDAPKSEAKAEKADAPKSDARAEKADAAKNDAAGKADDDSSKDEDGDGGNSRGRGRGRNQGGNAGGTRNQGGNQNRNDGRGQGNEGRNQGNEGRNQGNEGRNQGNEGRNQGNEGRNQGQQGGNVATDEDDELGNSRRRNRRGRNRSSGTGRSNADVDTSYTEDDVLVPAAGILDILDNYAFVRTTGYLPSENDVYVSLAMVRKWGLRRGDAVVGQVRQPREGERKEKFNPMVKIDSVNGMTLEDANKRVEFSKLTPLYPSERLRLESEAGGLTGRVIDLVSPIGKGQRGLIVSPPKAGKTMIMQQVANAITDNNPEVHLMIVLVDERPEEVTDFQRTVKGEVIASTFDRPATDHTMVAELA